MNNSFGYIKEEALDFALTQNQIKQRRAERAQRQKRERARMLAERKRVRAQRKEALDNRPKKNWGNFLR